MKNIYFILSLLLVFIISPSFAYNTTISTYIYKSTLPSQDPNPSLAPIHASVRRINFINNTTGIPELETALSAASGIFTDAMKKEGIELVPMNVEVLTADVGSNEDILCKVEINYSDTVNFNYNYHYFGEYENQYNQRVLLPMAMVNQSKRKSEGVAMRIKLRPDIPYHCDTTMAPEGEYDAITILLRALAMGCGIQSTFNPSTLTVGYDVGEKTYVSAFDTKIYNEDGASLVQVADGDLSANTFLAGKAVITTGNFGNGNYESIELYNEKKLVPNLPATELTINTISPENYTNDDYLDLLDPWLTSNISIREVTQYTMAMLRYLGWEYDFLVGAGSDLYDLYNCQLQGVNTILSPNTSYLFSLDKNGIILESDTHCELQTTDSLYTIGSTTISGPGICSFSYTNLPSNVQWRRNPVTKNIIGQIVGTASLFFGSTDTNTKICDIEIPYKPNKPIVHRSESVSQNNVLLDLSAFANGSNTYTISYTGLGDGIPHIETITANAIDTIYSLPATQLYDFTIYGTNSQGNSDSYNFTMGASVVPDLYLNASISGTNLRYYLDANHSQNLPCVNISSVTLNTIGGLLLLSSNALPGEAINISSLPRGYFVLSVVANGQTYSKLMYKR